MEQGFDVVVIGAGPAGLLAAGRAAMGGARVLLLEKMEKPGRKLRITGKGRCNITNVRPWHEFSGHVHPTARFFKPSFVHFSNTSAIAFFESIGLPVVTERGDRVFPASQRAQDVADILVHWVKKQGVEIRCNAEVLHLKTSDGRVSSVEFMQGNVLQQVNAQCVILATGGLSYPATGSTGDGYRMAKELGHAITDLRPSLVALDISNHFKILEGLELKNVSLRLLVDNVVRAEEFGELVFTNTGVDGAIILRVSRRAVDALIQKKRVAIQLNLKPALSDEQLKKRVHRECESLERENLSTLLRKLLPAQLVVPFMSVIGMSGNKKNTTLSDSDMSKIASTLHEWTFELCGFQGYERAVITAGGLSLKEIDSKTMQSNKIRNLFFAGELLDLDADTGGYNLQIAFSTGFLAGKSAAESII